MFYCCLNLLPVMKCLMKVLMWCHFGLLLNIKFGFSGQDIHESYVEDQKLFRRSMSVGDLFYLEMALKSASLG